VVQLTEVQYGSSAGMFLSSDNLNMPFLNTSFESEAPILHSQLHGHRLFSLFVEIMVFTSKRRHIDGGVKIASFSVADLNDQLPVYARNFDGGYNLREDRLNDPTKHTNVKFTARLQIKYSEIQYPFELLPCSSRKGISFRFQLIHMSNENSIIQNAFVV